MDEAPKATDFRELEAILEHTFARGDLLVRALTHRSLANEVSHEIAQANVDRLSVAVGDNERLEYLGDAVLGLVVAEALYLLHPEWREGELTRVRSGLVSRQHMAQVAEQIDLSKYLRLSKGEERSGLRHKSTVLSNTMEAVMGALFVDGGLDPVRAFVRSKVMGEVADRLASELQSGEALGNYKSALQEFLQAAHAAPPVYRLKSESGPDHHKRFMVEVRLRTKAGLRGEPLARGTGRTKKLAEQEAARRALDRLSREGEDAVDLSGEKEGK